MRRQVIRLHSGFPHRIMNPTGWAIVAALALLLLVGLAQAMA